MDPDQLERLQSQITNRIERGFKAMVREAQDANPIADIEARLRAGDYDRLLVGIDDAADKLGIEVNTGYVQAGQKMSRAIDSQIDAKHTFDVADEDAVGWMTDQAETLTQAMVSEQQQVARQIAEDGKARGWSTKEIAEEIRSSIGLNSQQADFIASYRNALEGGKYANALNRELADGRYDNVIERAQAGIANMTEDQIDAMVDKYRGNWVKARGEFVGNMEGQSAMNAGISQSVDQAIGTGDVDPSWVSKTWITMDDGKVRPSHRTMDGQTVAIDDNFTSGYGVELRYPGDEDADASETANCRCLMSVSVDVPVAKKLYVDAHGHMRLAA